MKTHPDSLPLTPVALLPYCRDCRDLSEWPERWMGEEKDLPVGQRLVEYFMPFLLHLAESGLSKRTIQNHVDNMWLLGGEIIRDVNEEPRLRKNSAEQLVRTVVHEDGGPLIHNGWEDEQRSFDSTCRKFHRFLTQSQRRDPPVTHRFPGRARKRNAAFGHQELGRPTMNGPLSVTPQMFQ